MAIGSISMTFVAALALGFAPVTPAVVTVDRRHRLPVPPSLVMIPGDTFDPLAGQVATSRPVTDASVDTSDSWTEPNKTASARQFALWLKDRRDAGDADLSGWITARRMYSLHWEYCDGAGVAMLTERQLFNAIKRYGIETRRPPGKIVNGRTHRPTLYRVKPGRKGRSSP